MTVEVRSTSAQKPTAAPGVNVAMVDPLAGLLLKLIAPSVQVVSVTGLTFCAPVDPLVTHMRSLADWIDCPASDCKPNFRYVSRTGEESDCKSTAVPKLSAGSSPATYASCDGLIVTRFAGVGVGVGVGLGVGGGVGVGPDGVGVGVPPGAPMVRGSNVVSIGSGGTKGVGD